MHFRRIFLWPAQIIGKKYFLKLYPFSNNLGFITKSNPESNFTMRQNEAILSILYRYYRQEELSNGEKQLLDNWMANSESNQLLFDELSNTQAWEAKLADFKSVNADKAEEYIRRRLEGNAGSARISWWRAAAAIVGILVLLGAGWYYWQISQAVKIEPPATDSPYSNVELFPGDGVVQLTLADGKVVSIDGQSQQILQNGKLVAAQENGILTYMNSEKENSSQINRLTTPIGRVVLVVLSDGTKVWLNALSNLEYPMHFNDKERTVKLNGEGYFEVANAASPFIVQTRRGKVEVLGTHFNINDYANEPAMGTTLLQGSLRISNETQSKILQPGQEGRIQAGNDIATFSADTHAILGWKNNIFNFSEASYEEIFRQVARWYKLEVEFRGDINARFSGILPRDRPLQDLLKILQKGGQAHFELIGQKLIVTP